MFFDKDEVEIPRLVSFYSIYNCVYFPILILGLTLTNGIYYAGKFKFGFVISFIVVAELVKYFTSVIYLKTRDVNLSKKSGERSISSILRITFFKIKVKDGFKSLIVTSGLMIAYFVISILYGAEVFSKYEETFMFSCLLTVLTIFPACVNLGSQSIIALILGSKPINKLEALFYQNLCFTIFGAWIGAFVIPLDWDRAWQVWPIPCSLGALIGFAVSHFVMIFQANSGLKKKTRKSYLFQK